MALLVREVVRNLRALNYRSFLTLSRSVYTHDHNFEYFRNKISYKDSIVQLNDDLTECKLPGPGYSFLIKEHEIQTDGFFFHLMQRENVMKLSAAQLKEIMCLMANAKIDTVKYANALKYIDEKCALSVERWPLDLSLYILDAWFIILGPKAFKKYYYSVITSMWSRKMKKCSKYNLILILYFIGMSKTPPPFLMELLEHKIENFALDLTDEELAIACLSFFKTSTRVKSKLLMKKSCMAAENFMLKNVRFHLISILKCLRLSLYYDASLMKSLADYIRKEHTSFNFVECTNFLANFATQNMYCSEVYNCLENRGILLLSSEETTSVFNETIEKTHPSERSRVKDLARFLWGMAFVGHELKDKSVNFIISSLNSKLSSGEFERNLPALIDSLQSLVLLNHYNNNLIDYVSSSSFKNKLFLIDKAKPKYQLYFIYRSVYIENSKIEAINVKFTNHIPKTLEKDIVERNGFQDLINYFADRSVSNSFNVCYIMPHIMISGIVISSKHKDKTSTYRTLLKLIEVGIISKNILGILGEDKNCTCIEILDPSVCIKDSTEPLALMKTKIRQLQKLNFNVITLTPKEISFLNDSSEFEKSSKLEKLFV